MAQFTGANNRLSGTVTPIENGEARVRVEGVGAVAARAVSCGVNQSTMLSVRPERVMIGDADAPNRMTGMLVQLIYLGDHIRCRMQVAGTDDFIVNIPNSHAKAALRVGEETAVGWLTDDCRALDAA